MSDILNYLVEKFDGPNIEHRSISYYSNKSFTEKSLFILQSCIDDANILSKSTKEEDYWQSSINIAEGIGVLKFLISFIKTKFNFCKVIGKCNILLQDLILCILASILYLYLCKIKGSIVYNIFNNSIIKLITNMIHFVCDIFAISYEHEDERSNDEQYNIEKTYLTNKRNKKDKYSNANVIYVKHQEDVRKLLSILNYFYEIWLSLYNQAINNSYLNMQYFNPTIITKFGIGHMVKLKNLTVDLIIVSEKNIDPLLHSQSIIQLLCQILMAYCFAKNDDIRTGDLDCDLDNLQTDSFSTNSKMKALPTKDFRLRLDVVFKIFYEDIQNFGLTMKAKHSYDSHVSYMWKFFEKIQDMIDSGLPHLSTTYQQSLLLFCQNLAAGITGSISSNSSSLENIKSAQFETVKLIYLKNLTTESRVEFTIWLARFSTSAESIHVCRSADLLSYLMGDNDLFHIFERNWNAIQDKCKAYHFNPQSLYYLHPIYLLRIIILGCIVNDKSPYARNKFLTCLSKFIETYFPLKAIQPNLGGGGERCDATNISLFEHIILPCIQKPAILSNKIINIPNEPLNLADNVANKELDMTSQKIEIKDESLEQENNARNDSNKTLTEQLIEEYLHQNPTVPKDQKERPKRARTSKFSSYTDYSCDFQSSDSELEEVLSYDDSDSMSQEGGRHQISVHVPNLLPTSHDIRTQFVSFTKLTSKLGLFPFALRIKTAADKSKSSDDVSAGGEDTINITLRHIFAVLTLRLTHEPVAYVRRLGIEIVEKMIEKYLYDPVRNIYLLQQPNSQVLQTCETNQQQTQIFIALIRLIEDFKLVAHLFDACLNDKTVMVRKQALSCLTKYVLAVNSLPTISKLMGDEIFINFLSKYHPTCVTLTADWIKTLILCYASQSFSMGLNERAYELLETHLLNPIILSNVPSYQITLGWKFLEYLVDSITNFGTPSSTTSSSTRSLIPFDSSPWLPFFKSVFAKYMSQFTNIDLFAYHPTTNNQIPKPFTKCDVYSQILMLTLSNLKDNCNAYVKQSWFLIYLTLQIKPEAYTSLLDIPGDVQPPDTSSFKTTQKKLSEYQQEDDSETLIDIVSPYLNLPFGLLIQKLLRFTKKEIAVSSSVEAGDISAHLASLIYELPTSTALNSNASNFKFNFNCKRPCGENVLMFVLENVKCFCINFACMIISPLTNANPNIPPRSSSSIITKIAKDLICFYKICSNFGQSVVLPLITDKLSDSSHFPWKNLAFLTGLINNFKTLNTLFEPLFEALLSSVDIFDKNQAGKNLLHEVRACYQQSKSKYLEDLRSILDYNLQLFKSVLDRQNFYGENDLIIKKAIHVIGDIITANPRFLTHDIFLSILNLVITKRNQFQEIHKGDGDKLAFNPSKIVSDQVFQATSNAEHHQELTNMSSTDIENSMEEVLHSIEVSPKCKANAYLVLGKICMLSEDYAKKCLPAFIYELYELTGKYLTIDNMPIRNNLSLMLIDFIKRYPYLSDPYIPTIVTLTLRKVSFPFDSQVGLSDCHEPLINFGRYQSFSALLTLLREAYIQSTRPGIVIKLIPLLVDSDIRIRQLARTQLVDTLLFISNINPESLKKDPGFIQLGQTATNRGKKNFFFSNFLDILFYVNGLESNTSVRSRQRRRLSHLSVNLSATMSGGDGTFVESPGAAGISDQFNTFLVGNKFETLLNEYVPNATQLITSVDNKASNLESTCPDLDKNDQSLAGIANFKKRFEIYEICLNYLKTDQKFILLARLCSEILSPAVDILPYISQRPTSPSKQQHQTITRPKLSHLAEAPNQREIFRNILRDTFALLSSPGLQCNVCSFIKQSIPNSAKSKSAKKAGNKTKDKKDDKSFTEFAEVEGVGEDGECNLNGGEEDVGTAAANNNQMENTRKGLIHEILKKNISENILPVLSNLRRGIKKYESRSPLLKYLDEYVLYLCNAYNNEVEELFINNADLLQEGSARSYPNTSTPRKRHK